LFVALLYVSGTVVLECLFMFMRVRVHLRVYLNNKKKNMTKKIK